MQKQIDMVNGSMPLNMVRFVTPIILTGILSLLFNMCDLIIVGQFVGDQAVAAISAPGSLIYLLIELFLGLSIGTNVLMAQAYGSGDIEKNSRILHTAIVLSLASDDSGAWNFPIICYGKNKVEKNFIKKRRNLLIPSFLWHQPAVKGEHKPVKSIRHTVSGNQRAVANQ